MTLAYGLDSVSAEPQHDSPTAQPLRFATDYPAVLHLLKIPANMRAAERIIQFPFSIPVIDEKTEEELTRIAEKRKEQAKKLQELAAKSRMEKV